MKRLGRPRRHAPAPQPDPVVCGPCGQRLASAREYELHAVSCHMAPPQARAADGIRALSNAMVALADRLPTKQATAVTYSIQRLAVGLGAEQRHRLAWLVDEVTDAIDAVERRATKAAAS